MRQGDKKPELPEALQQQAIDAAQCFFGAGKGRFAKRQGTTVSHGIGYFYIACAAQGGILAGLVAVGRLGQYRMG